MKQIVRANMRWAVGGALALLTLALLALVLTPQLRAPEPLPPSASRLAQGWRSSTPEEQGFDSVKLAEGLQAMRQSGSNIHSFLLIRNDAVVVDAYFYPYDRSTYHDLASVTKSLLTTLVGIAADQGKLDLDQPMLSFFPNRTIANRDARKERITVRHLASMSSGLDCTAEGGEQTLQEMRASDDWVQFALDREVAWEPGTHFVYCSVGKHLLSAILQEATGMPALEFARTNLFAPLGITDVYWPADPQGYTRGWGDLCLHPRDAARLGYLWLNHGQWDGRQIVSREWVTASTERQIATGPDHTEDYGYGWWVARPEKMPTFFLADGRGGQRISVVPAWNLVLVTTGGGFDPAELDPYLRAALVDPSKPLPANAAGVAELNATLTAIAQGPAPQSVPRLPETANAITGQTFVFQPNPLRIRSVRLDFDAAAEASLILDIANESPSRVGGVGLDGLYRPSRAGPPTAARGRWADAQTFAVDYTEGPGLNIYTVRMRVDGDRMRVEVADPTSGRSLSLVGRLEQP